MLMGVHPLRAAHAERAVLGLGVAGYGIGTLTLTAEGGAPVETELRMLMGAAGARGTLVAAAQSASRWR